MLRRVGASKVWVATLARAQTSRVAMWDDGMLAAAQGFGESKTRRTEIH